MKAPGFHVTPEYIGGPNDGDVVQPTLRFYREIRVPLAVSSVGAMFAPDDAMLPPKMRIGIYHLHRDGDFHWQGEEA